MPAFSLRDIQNILEIARPTPCLGGSKQTTHLLHFKDKITYNK